MTYNIAELVISSGFWFLIGFVIAKVRPKNALREALYRANPELRPDMVYTINGKLEIFWYRYEGEGINFLATVVTEENKKVLDEWYKLFTVPKPGDYVQLIDGDGYLMKAETFDKTYKRVLTV